MRRSLPKISVGIFLALTLSACGPRLPSPAKDDPLIGCWRGEDFQPVLKKRTVWLMNRRADGTFSIEFTAVGEPSPSAPQVEEGIWTHSNGYYKTITLRLGGRSVDTSDPHFTDEYDVVSLTGNVMRYNHRRMKVTFESRKEACPGSAA